MQNVERFLGKWYEAILVEGKTSLILEISKRIDDDKYDLKSTWRVSDTLTYNTNVVGTLELVENTKIDEPLFTFRYENANGPAYYEIYGYQDNYTICMLSICDSYKNQFWAFSRNGCITTKQAEEITGYLDTHGLDIDVSFFDPTTGIHL